MENLRFRKPPFTRQDPEFEQFIQWQIWCNENNYVIKENSVECWCEPKPPLTEDEIKMDLRQLRTVECFRIINRGQAWYNTLTEHQRQELQVWYRNWLDVTLTKVIPVKPTWIT
jgi:leucyl-tRNA synthetase